MAKFIKNSLILFSVVFVIAAGIYCISRFLGASKTKSAASSHDVSPRKEPRRDSVKRHYTHLSLSNTD